MENHLFLSNDICSISGPSFNNDSGKTSGQTTSPDTRKPSSKPEFHDSPPDCNIGDCITNVDVPASREIIWSTDTHIYLCDNKSKTITIVKMSDYSLFNVSLGVQEVKGILSGCSLSSLAHMIVAEVKRSFFGKSSKVLYHFTLNEAQAEIRQREVIVCQDPNLVFRHGESKVGVYCVPQSDEEWIDIYSMKPIDRIYRVYLYPDPPRVARVRNHDKSIYFISGSDPLAVYDENGKRTTELGNRPHKDDLNTPGKIRPLDIFEESKDTLLVICIDGQIQRYEHKNKHWSVQQDSKRDVFLGVCITKEHIVFLAEGKLYFYSFRK